MCGVWSLLVFPREGNRGVPSRPAERIDRTRRGRWKEEVSGKVACAVLCMCACTCGTVLHTVDCVTRSHAERQHRNTKNCSQVAVDCNKNSS